MDNEQLKAYVLRKFTCSINVALSNGIPLTASPVRRAFAERKGNFYVWNYKRDARGNITYTYALDTILIGRKTISGYHSEDIAKALCLQPGIGNSIECGFTKETFAACNIKTILSGIMYDVGLFLRRKFHTYIN